MWQDFVIMLGNAIFSICLIPTALENRKLKRCDIPYRTSVITAMVLYIFTFTFFTLNLWYAGTMAFIVGVVWSYIAYQRFKYKGVDE